MVSTGGGQYIGAEGMGGPLPSGWGTRLLNYRDGWGALGRPKDSKSDSTPHISCRQCFARRLALLLITSCSFWNP